MLSADKPYHHSNEYLFPPRFLVHRKIGEGGFGSVYLASDTETKSICAVKVLKAELSGDVTIRGKLESEARVWMRVGKHPHIVQPLFVDIYNGNLILALEFISSDESGKNTLQERVGTQIPLRQLLKWSIQLCTGMSFANSRGIVAHRDLKPGNLMIDACGNLKITDFGLATFALDVDSAYNIDPSGTPAFMPPEQFTLGSVVDARSDIYSFGLVACCMATGTLPFDIHRRESNLDPFDYFFALHSTYVPVQLQSPLNDIIQKCLKKNSQDRYQSFEELSHDLIRLFEDVTGGLFRPASPQQARADELINLATSFELVKDHNHALRCIEEALEIIPFLPIALNNKAAILCSVGRQREAIEIWQKLTITNEDLSRPFYNLGNALINVDPRKAIDYYEKAIDREPNYLPALLNAAICYQNLGIPGRALVMYNRALSVDPFDAQITYNRAFLLYESMNFREALDGFEQTIELNPVHVSAHNYAGLCYWELGSFDTALTYFDAALQLNPEYPFAIQNRENLLRVMHERSD